MFGIDGPDLFAQVWTDLDDNMAFKSNDHVKSQHKFSTVSAIVKCFFVMWRGEHSIWRRKYADLVALNVDLGGILGVTIISFFQ